MTKPQYQFLGLQRLASEHGLDVRATVLRVATDLFCQTRTHFPADIARYTDLALALLETADAPTRSAVAAKLAKISHAPERVLQYLLDDKDAAVSGAVLSNSAVVKLENLVPLLAECGPADAAAVARRTDIDAQTVNALASHPHLLVPEALLENTGIELDAAATALLVARSPQMPALAKLLLAHPNADAAELAPLYQQASKELRADIRVALEARTARSAPAVPPDALAALNDAVLAADRDRIAAALAKALGLDPAGMARVLDDPTGEVFALALAAAGIKRAPAVNLLLVAALPEVRTSVERIFASADVHDSTSRRVAREIVAAIAGERRNAAAVFEPFMHPSGTPQRAAAVRRRVFAEREATRRPDIIGKR